MTALELRDSINQLLTICKLEKRGIITTIIVDHETYANVCQEIFNNHIADSDYVKFGFDDTVSATLDHYWTSIAIGKSNNGIMFKGVELILKEKI